MKDVLVHLDGGDRVQARLDLAIALAKRNGARLTGLFAQAESHGPAVIARRASDQLIAARERVESLFHHRLADSGLAWRWWSLAHGEPGHVVAETVFCARYCDVAVFGQTESDDPRIPSDLLEQVIMNSGRPALIVPYSGDFPSVAESICLAWNGSREASRALHDALPLLKRAHQVHLLAIRDTGPGGHRPNTVPQVDIVAHLRAHGVPVHSERLAGADSGVMDLLLTRSFELGADLLVMGAHGGLGMGFLRGAGTRFMLRHMTMPVMMSN
jgi:nucleotide-binding universal stress UspA family protein